MAWFIKTETFTISTAALTNKQRHLYLDAHREWVNQLCRSGRRISSGFLVDDKGLPGGGGLLIFEANTYADALALVKDDPMIMAGLVNWKLQEWIPFSGDGWP